MDEVPTISLDELKEIYKKNEEEEKTWKHITILDRHLGLTLNGQCHYYEDGGTYSSIEEAIEVIREELIGDWTNAIKTYSRIVKQFDNGQEYDEYFTKERIKYFHNLLELYPKWIDYLKAGKLLINCQSAREQPQKNCKSQWVDGYHPNDLGLCTCGSKLKYI